jgi:tetratricopeptide (TPR) repeat protein
VPRRQQTLRNTIEWSYELLNDDERALFARLGVFAGGCQLDAVEAVCADAGEEDQVLERLDSLVSQSLVQFRQAPGELPRFTMLETIHAFARELLESSGQAAGLRSAHARHYLCLAESAAPHLVGGEQLQWVSRLSGEQDNLRAALDWAVGADGDGSVALRLAGALWPFWEMAGLLQEGQRWLGTAMAHADGAPSTALLRACSGAGTLAWGSGDDDAAADWHERALGLARRLRDRHEEAFALNNLGAVHAERREYPQAESLYAQAADLALRVGARRTYGMTLHNTAEIYFHRGELDRAAHTYEEALVIFREIGDQWLINASLRGLAMAGLRQGDQERATLALNQSLRLAAQLGENNWVAENFEGLAAVAQHARRPQQAARLLAAAEALRSRIGVPIQLPDRPDVDALTLEVRRELTDEAFRVAWEAGQSVAIAAIVDEVLQGEKRPKRPH